MLDDILDIIVKEYNFEYLGHEKGFHRFGKKSNGLIKKALKLASQAEVAVVYLGLDEAIENADYQLIADSVKKDFDNAFDDFYEVKRNFEDLDI